MIQILRGTEAQRTAYGGLEDGRFMYCTDSGKLYIGTPTGDKEFMLAGSSINFIDLADVPASYAGKAGRPVKVNTNANGLIFWPNFNLDDYPASPDAMNDEFDDGSIDAKWTKVNDPAGGDALSEAIHAGHLYCGLLELGTDNFDNFVRIYQAPPTGTQTLEFIAKVALAASGISGEQAEFMTAGIYLGENVNDQYISAEFQYNNASQTYLIARASGGKDNGTGGSANMATLEQQIINPTQFIYLKLKKTTASAYTAANTYEAWFSLNGLIWQQCGSDSKTFTALCNECGLFFRRPKSQTGTPKGEVIVDFFRRTD